ncbi:hypothetical protein SPRG_20110 [Saprolegnia parasitica CBS 223.65]|uniref:Hexose transporter 1 n=1 Tax=Saprolegnia parasitica (strain CBS 223.65) TaxID=695850 RepID=A0A067CE11_SAPPC|nr:hypothetical protein SPRG_20110 [Saprolegnia parasitica CBS 223.65]KDO29004.1 hypothetical protein SPRG_20110 [Saprolegnia parasitica CBS 223.65]|eukprot:XP_012200333.1 hypothetical protein SPRG_20110 [Saprolegnia parasitica CBS 223.65]
MAGTQLLPTTNFGAVSTPKPDVYVAMPPSSPTQYDGKRVTSRSTNRSSSRRHLSRLESMITEEHSKALQPARALYLTITVALMGTFQLGWILTQLNYKPFNSKCGEDPIPKDNCIMFPGHSGNEWTMAVTSWTIGAAIGTIGSSAPADKYGRQRTLYFNAIIMIVGAAIQSASTGIYLFAFGRLVSGIAAGAAVNVANVLVSEISPMEMRGLFATGLQVAIAFGSLAVTTCHYFIGYSYGWRLLVGFPIALGGLQIFLLPFTAKSPVWLISVGKPELALAELNRLYLPCDTEAILHAIQASHDEMVDETVGINPWQSLFSKRYRLQLTIAIVLCLAKQLCGINAVMYYSSSIFASAGVNDPRIGNTIINVVRTIGMIFAAKVMDKFHRRTLLLFGMASWRSILSVLATAVYVGAYCFSIGSMAWMVAAEIFPDFLHASAGGVGTMFTFSGDFLVGISYPTLSKPDVLSDYAFLIFLGLLVIFIVFIYFVVPETAQRTFDEIQAEFDRVSPPSPKPVADVDPFDSFE